MKIKFDREEEKEIMLDFLTYHCPGILGLPEDPNYSCNGGTVEINCRECWEKALSEGGVIMEEEAVIEHTDSPKPCPFCGGDNITLGFKYFGPAYIHCEDCGATMLKSYDGNKSNYKTELTSRWNTRKEAADDY